MKRLLLVALAASLAVLAVSIAPVGAKAKGAEKQPVVREWNQDGTMHTEGEVIGFTNLVRKTSGISGTTHVQGLMPGGVYTFWMVAIDPSFFPAEADLSLIYVDRGNARVVGQNGRATVHWSAPAGDASIVPPPGPIFDDALEDIGDRVVRIEIAYHGQADDAPDQAAIDQWLSDFWSGDPTVCPDPPFSPGNVVPPGPQGTMQPHCPVNFASTHAPG